MHTLSQLRSGELYGITKLKLSENLTTFPKEILTLANSLEILDLSDNKLTDLPEELTELKKLKIIFASQNNFKHLPEVLGKLSALEMIGFKSNKIKMVSENSLPKTLRWLILTDNFIEQLPNSIGGCLSLQKLMLAGNRLTQLPEALSQAKALELVRISANNLTQCPEHLLKLPKLAWLAFAGNPFVKNAKESATEKVENASQTPHSVPEISSNSYKIMELLGQGASGVISKALWCDSQSNFPNDIAVKVFKGSVTSDGYPKDELRACLQVGLHPNLVQSIAQVNENNYLALIMSLIPAHFKNLGLPPTLKTCTRDTFPEGFNLSINLITEIINQMESLFEHIHSAHVSHGDLYAHNILFDEQGNIIFGDFGAASCYQHLKTEQQQLIKKIERRALGHLIEDLLSICNGTEKGSKKFTLLNETADNYIKSTW